MNVIYIDDRKRQSLNKINLDVAIEIINSRLLEYLEMEDLDQEIVDSVIDPLAEFALLAGYRRLKKICKDLLEADERGQGINYTEAMNAMAREIKWKPR